MSVRKIGNIWWINLEFNNLQLQIQSPAKTRARSVQYEKIFRERLAQGKGLFPNSAEIKQMDYDGQRLWE
jgi:hypothetical protein